jgi:hypothetical protein
MKNGMWTLFWMPLRRADFWVLALGCLALGWVLSLALPWFTALGPDSSPLLRQQWAFLVCALMGGFLLVHGLRLRGWVRGFSEAHTTFILYLSTFLLPITISALLALPSWKALGWWALACLWVMPLRELRWAPALGGGLFFVLGSLYALGEGSAAVWTALGLSPFLVHLGLACGRSRQQHSSP